MRQPSTCRDLRIDGAAKATFLCLGSSWVAHKKRVRRTISERSLRFIVTSRSNQILTGNYKDSSDDTDRRIGSLYKVSLSYRV
jgi:hypothetical protein